MDFKNYAQEVSARIKVTPQTLSNKRRMYKAAYGPLLKDVARAGKVLDYGCGPGEFLRFLAPYTQGALVGYDPSESQLELARQALKEVRNASLHSDPRSLKSGEFDFIFCLHVIEHIPDDQLEPFLHELCRLLSPTGKLVIATPNGMNPFSYAYYMSGDRTHVRMHSPLSLAQVLVAEGVEIVSIHRESPQTYDVMTALKTAVWWMMSHIVKLGVMSCAGGVRELRLPFTFAATFYVVAQKSSPRS